MNNKSDMVGVAISLDRHHPVRALPPWPRSSGWSSDVESSLRSDSESMRDPQRPRDLRGRVVRPVTLS